MVYPLCKTLPINGKFVDSFKSNMEDNAVTSNMIDIKPKWKKYWGKSLDCGFTSIFIGKDQPQVRSLFRYNL